MLVMGTDPKEIASDRAKADISIGCDQCTEHNISKHSLALVLMALALALALVLMALAMALVLDDDENTNDARWMAASQTYKAYH